MTGVTPADLLLYAAAVAIPVFLVSLLLAVRGHRRTALRERFGPEYDRTVAVRGSARRTVRDLEERERLAEELVLAPLPSHLRPALAARAAAAQWSLADDAARALTELAALALDALRARGYPEDEELTLRLVSVPAPGAAVALHRGLDRVGEAGADEEAAEDLQAFRAIADLLRRHVGLAWSVTDLLRPASGEALDDADEEPGREASAAPVADRADDAIAEPGVPEAADGDGEGEGGEGEGGGAPTAGDGRSGAPEATRSADGHGADGVARREGTGGNRRGATRTTSKRTSSG